MNTPTSKSLPLDACGALLAFDWADKKHDYAFKLSNSQEVKSGVVNNTPKAVHAFISKLLESMDGKPVAVILEQSRGTLVHMLCQHQGLVIYPVNPLTVSNFRKSFAVSGAKSDQADAAIMLELLEKHHQRLRPLVEESTETRMLERLVKERRQATDERTRCIEQAQAVLKEYYPLALEILDGDLTTNMACAFLEKWPEFNSIKRSQSQTLRKFFYANRSRSETKILQRLEMKERAVALTDDRAVIEPSVYRVRRLVRQLRALNTSIAEMETRIDELFASHEDAQIFESLPGAGAALAPRLLVAIGTDRERWRDANHLSVYSGIAPVIAESGNLSITSFRWTSNKFLRQSFHEFANYSRQHSKWAGEFYRRRKEKGIKHNTIIRALAFKWLRIIYACWKNRVPYSAAIADRKFMRNAA